MNKTEIFDYINNYVDDFNDYDNIIENIANQFGINLEEARKIYLEYLGIVDYDFGGDLTEGLLDKIIDYFFEEEEYIADINFSPEQLHDIESILNSQLSKNDKIDAILDCFDEDPEIQKEIENEEDRKALIKLAEKIVRQWR